MTQCECIPGCAFFNDKMAGMPVMADQMKHRYCTGENDKCARHMVVAKLGRAAVPSDLFPNQSDRALGLIAASHKEGAMR
ncbi:hypothetical protein [Pararhodospirillum oryzae]|nr:hypothetical protein [Pararhodospirillum oryzae]